MPSGPLRGALCAARRYSRGGLEEFHDILLLKTEGDPVDITYTKLNGDRDTASYWSLGPILRGYRDVMWLVNRSGESILVGVKRRKPNQTVIKDEIVEVIHIPKGKELRVSENGEAYIDD